MKMILKKQKIRSNTPDFPEILLFVISLSA